MKGASKLNILAIDCSTEFEIVAVTSSAGSADRTRRVDRSHSVTLFESISAALTEAGVSLKEIDLIACGIGPGSFTGLRIAAATARMLAQVLAVPAAPLSSPMIFAASAAASPGDTVIAAFDAKKGRVFGGVYIIKGDDSPPEELVKPGDYYITELAEAARGAERVIAAGSGCERYADDIKKIIPAAVISERFIPSGICACKLAVLTGTAGNYDRLLPDYARKSDAETALEQRMK
jgi:tRNA threonylcarbamoyladenosine biosynthesis protein TsaB